MVEEQHISFVLFAICFAVLRAQGSRGTRGHFYCNLCSAGGFGCPVDDPLVKVRIKTIVKGKGKHCQVHVPQISDAFLAQSLCIAFMAVMDRKISS